MWRSLELQYSRLSKFPMRWVVSSFRVDIELINRSCECLSENHRTSDVTKPDQLCQFFSFVRGVRIISARISSYWIQNFLALCFSHRQTSLFSNVFACKPCILKTVFVCHQIWSPYTIKTNSTLLLVMSFVYGGSFGMYYIVTESTIHLHPSFSYDDCASPIILKMDS